MIGAKTGRWAGLCTVLALAGCGTDASRSGFYDIGRAAVGLVGDSGARSGILGAENLTASDASLRSFGEPLIKVTRAREGLSAGLRPLDNKGEAAIWVSSDGKTVTLFNGLLIATRGFGNDLSSAKVPGAVAGQTDVLREHYLLGGDDRMRRHAFFCDFTGRGRQTINVVGVSFETDLVTEVCTGENLSFENSYWFLPQGGLIKSQQWASPEIGSLIIEYVPQTGGRAAAPTVVQERDGVTVILGSLD